ncbi:hypothetical protein [Bradyrhizobium sp. USDA 4529]
MGAKLGDAGRARELARLFEAWRRAFDAGDERMMAVTKRAIDAVAAGDSPSSDDQRAIGSYRS